MGWFDAEGIPNGRGGVTAVDEPSVVECADGRLMLMTLSVQQSTSLFFCSSGP